MRAFRPAPPSKLHPVRSRSAPNRWAETHHSEPVCTLQTNLCDFRSHVTDALRLTSPRFASVFRSWAVDSPPSETNKMRAVFMSGSFFRFVLDNVPNLAGNTAVSVPTRGNRHIATVRLRGAPHAAYLRGTRCAAAFGFAWINCSNCASGNVA